MTSPRDRLTQNVFDWLVEKASTAELADYITRMRANKSDDDARIHLRGIVDKMMAVALISIDGTFTKAPQVMPLRIALIQPETDHIVADSLDLTGRTAAEFSDQFADSGRTAARYLATVNGLAQGDDHDAMRFVENVMTGLMERSAVGGLDAFVVDHDNRDGKAIRADSMFLGFMEAYRSGQS